PREESIGTHGFISFRGSGFHPGTRWRRCSRAPGWRLTIDFRSPFHRRHAMSRKLLYCAGAGLLLIAGIASLLASRPLPPNAVEIREKFAYRSLASRLEFEARGAPRDSAKSPLLPEAGLGRLKRIELVFDHQDSKARLLSLQTLHSREVADFIRRPGFGLSR